MEIADSGAAKDLKWVVRVRDAACRPGAERISERFFSTIGAPTARGSKPLGLGFGTARLRCHPDQSSSNKVNEFSWCHIKKQRHLPGSPHGEVDGMDGSSVSLDATG